MNGAVLNAASDRDARGKRTQTLRTAGIEVVEAANARQALAGAADCHIALLDPALSEALAGLKAASQGIQVVQLLSPEDDAVIPDGADAYLYESVPGKVLIATVQALDRHRSQTLLPAAVAEDLKSWIENAVEPMFLLDTRGRILAMNQPFVQMHGMQEPASRPETLNQYFEMFETRRPDGSNLPLGEWPAVRAREGQTITGVEVHCRNRRTGHAWIALQNAAPVRGPSGDIRYVMVALQDITQARETERALKFSEERFRAVAEAIPNLVWTTDSTGAITFVSRQWLQYTGTRLEEALDSGWLNSIHPEDVAAAEKIWTHAVGWGAVTRRCIDYGAATALTDGTSVAERPSPTPMEKS